MRVMQLKIGALVAYACLCVVLATPSGSRLNNRQVWASQHNQDEFEAWAKGLRNLGINVTGKQFEDLLWSVTSTYLGQRTFWLRPLALLSEQVGFAQSWRMFSNPQTSPSRLWVELDEGNGFKPLFVAGSTTYTWRHEFFTHHRIRKLLGRIGRAGRAPEYNQLGKWLARQAAQDFPHASTLRLRVYTWTTEPPSRAYQALAEPELGRPGGSFQRNKTFDLREFRQ